MKSPPRCQRRQAVPEDIIGDGPNDDGDMALSALTGSSSQQSGKRKTKPPITRVILDVNPVTMMLETHLMPCPQCGARLKLSFPTVYVASGCQIQCPFFGSRDKDCKFNAVSLPDPAGMTLPA